MNLERYRLCKLIWLTKGRIAGLRGAAKEIPWNLHQRELKTFCAHKKKSLKCFLHIVSFKKKKTKTLQIVVDNLKNTNADILKLIKIGSIY